MEHLQPKISGSNYPFSDKLLSPQTQRSACDWSHSFVTTIPEAGALIPIFCDEVIAGSDYDINVEALIRVLPQVVPLYSTQRIYIDAFYVPYSCIWKNGLIYMSKGDTGNVNLSKPVLKRRADFSTHEEGIYYSPSEAYTIQPDDIFQFLGLPIGKKLSDLGEINCLPVASYISIYRNYYMNRNVRLGDHDWFPDDPSDFRLDDTGTFISSITENTFSCSVLVGYNGTENGHEYFPVNINVNKGYFYRDYADDYFTSALPFPQRGDAPKLTIDTTVNLPAGNYPFKFGPTPTGPFISGGLYASITPGETFSNSSAYLSGDGSEEITARNYISITNSNTPAPTGSVNFNLRTPGDTLDLTGVYAGVNIPSTTLSLTGLGFTLDEFRQLAIAQQELERMARTDGSSSQFYYTFFGISPRRAVDYRPVYIGGTYKDLIFSEVVQQSQSTKESPLGSYAGHGIASLSGNCGSVHTDENGYIMILASIMPDVYYTQGLSKMWTRNTQDEEFLPGRDKMGLVPIYNRELFVSGNSNIDGDLFAYQDSYDEFRYKDNRISGKIADASNKSFSPYTQARFFANSPKYSSAFMTSKDIRKDYLSAPVEDAYTGRFEFNIRAVQPITFKGNPAPVI